MADISLLFDVATGSNPAGDSQALIKSQLEAIVKEINTKPLSIKFQADENSLKQIRAQIQNITAEVGAGVAPTIKTPKIKDSSSKSNNFSNNYKDATKAVREYYSAVQRLHRSGLNKTIAFDDKTGVWSDKSGNYPVLTNQLNKLTQAYNNAQVASSQFAASEKQSFDTYRIEQEDKYRLAIENLTNKERERAETFKHTEAILNSHSNTINRSSDSLLQWSAAKNSIHKESRDAYAALESDVEEAREAKRAYDAGAISLEEYTKKIDTLKASLRDNGGIIKQNGDAAKSFSERIGGLAKKFTQWFGVSQVIMWIYKNLKKMVDTVIELDTAMTELKKVTNETDATYERFLNNASTRAKKLGASLSDVVTASADFARLGFNIEEAEDLADAAIVYKNVGDGIKDVSDASESIIATMQAFGVEAKDVMTIVDKFNEVGNNYAISSKGVGDALLRSAAAMHSANNTLDETIALATASNTIVQDPDKVGKCYAQQYSNVLQVDSYIG